MDGGVASARRHRAIDQRLKRGLRARVGIRRTQEAVRRVVSEIDSCGLLNDAFIDRFAITGTPEHRMKRLEALLALGLDHLVIVGPSADVAPSDMAQSYGLFRTEILPALKACSQPGPRSK